LANPLPLEEFFCASKNPLLHPQACFLPAFHGQGSMEHLNQGLCVSTVTSVDLLQTLQGVAEGAEKPMRNKIGDL